MNRRRRLGQHYLVDDEVVDEIIRLVHDLAGKRILEIGAGKGTLTSELAEITENLVAFEIDPENHARTKQMIDSGTVELKLGDAFDHESEFDVLVSSLPYSQSSRFIEWLSSKKFVRAVVILQKDFVDKILAAPGERNYRAISVITQCAFKVEVIRRIQRSSFEPQPRVNSQLVVFSPIRNLDKRLVEVIKKLFSVRRRRIGVAVKVLGMKSNEIDLEMRSRVYQIEPEELLQIAKDLLSSNQETSLKHNPIKSES